MPPTDAGPLTKRQQQAVQTRDRMLRAAREVFETKGYQAASVAAITRSADTAHGTFYLYFRNRDDAFAQVIAEAVDEILDESRARLSDGRYEGLEGVIRGVLVVLTRHAGLWRALLEGTMLSPEIEQIWVAATGEFTARIARRLAREQAEGDVRDFDAAEAAEALSSMTQWYAFRKLTRQGVEATDVDLDQATRTVADLWYHAIYGVTERD
jgi:AcrR family transcriptional regulator